MENFFYNDEFYSDIGDLCSALDLDEETIKSLPDNYAIEAFESMLEPVVSLSADWIFNRINEERYTEDGNESEKVYKILEIIDYATINAQMPKLYYPTRKKFIITKADLLD
jgi:spore cortex formation protein SpoVR/YcgB (stage V sporulation)